MYPLKLIPRILPFQQKWIQRNDFVYLQASPASIARRYTASKPPDDFCWKAWWDVFDAKIVNEVTISSNDIKELLKRIQVNGINDEFSLKILQSTTTAQFERTDYDVVDAIWRQLLQANVTLKCEHFHCMLSYYALHGNGEAAQQIYEDLIDSGFQEDAIAKQKLFRAYCKDGDTAKATALLDEFEASKTYITELMLNHFIQCNLKNGDIFGANRALEKLKANNFKLNFYTIYELLCFHIRDNDLENVIYSFNQFKENNINYLNRHVFEAMIQLSDYNLSDYMSLIPFLVSNEEFNRAIGKLMSEFVKCDKVELLPHIFKANDSKIDTNVKCMFTEMARANRPAAEYNNVWFELEEMNFHVRTHLEAYKPALQSQSSAIILEILQEMHSDPKEKLDESCFVQLMKLAADENRKKMNSVIDLMCTNYNIRPRLFFIASVIIPLLRKKDLDYVQIIGVLRKTKIRTADIILAGIQCALQENDLETAYLITTKYSACLADKTITIPLLKAYLSTQNVDAFVRLLRTIVDSITVTNLYYLKRASTQVTESDVVKEQERFLVQMIKKALLAQRSNTPQNLRLLETLSKEGFCISSENLRSIRKLLNVAEGSDIDKAVKKLCTKQSDHLRATGDI